MGKYYVFITACILMFVCIGCETQFEKAAKLLKERKYEEVLSKYADLPIASQAKDSIANQLLHNGRYSEIFDKYPNSPFVAMAKDSLAFGLLLEGSFTEAMKKYPNSQYARMAVESTATQLLKTGKYSEIIQLLNYHWELGLYSSCPGEYPTKVEKSARDSIAENLYRDNQYREILIKYPDSPAAAKVDKYHPEIHRKINRGKELAEEKRKQGEEEKLRRCRQSPSLCLRIGMSAKEVRSLVGYPDDINRTTSGSVVEQYVHEQWVFGGVYSQEMILLYFENGILTSWQE